MPLGWVILSSPKTSRDKALKAWTDKCNPSSILTPLLSLTTKSYCMYVHVIRVHLALGCTSSQLFETRTEWQWHACVLMDWKLWHIYVYKEGKYCLQVVVTRSRLCLETSLHALTTASATNTVTLTLYHTNCTATQSVLSTLYHTNCTATQSVLSTLYHTNCTATQSVLSTLYHTKCTVNPLPHKVYCNTKCTVNPLPHKVYCQPFTTQSVLSTLYHTKCTVNPLQKSTNQLINSLLHKL